MISSISSLKNTVFNKGLSLSLLTGLVISTASLYAPMASAAAIYKVVDEKTGQVTFTDRPQSYEQQAGKQISQTSVTTGNDSVGVNAASQSNSSSNQLTNSTQAPPAPADKPSTVKASVNYQLTITEPSEERAYRRPAQSIDVNVQVKPALQLGDRVSIMLDGNEVAQGLSTSVSTVDILPGAHTIKVVLKNEKGQIVNQAARTVYVIQNTQTLQNNKKIAEQLLAYQRLPWHQKVLLKLRQDGKQPNMLSFTKPQADKPTTLEEPVIK
ncbi:MULTISPECIES: DUF4124 domain-containing protein [unclassified Psychrobacter]|uniref:DUF4124 domain-containing protein n=1 Tax=unclassified Psychrobacter TaxID=196806 RepID=UPI0025F29F8A|nr:MULTISPECIES: DUF4124 domain-containing protein [unclassified Psychrobacter]